MTNEDISVLRKDIRELNSSIFRLESKLTSLEFKVGSLWFDLWGPALALAPWAFIILQRMLEHLLAPK